MAPPYWRLIEWPTARKLGNCIQHVCIVHEPETPWHLHDCCIECRTAWPKKKRRNRSSSYSARLATGLVRPGCGFFDEKFLQQKENENKKRTSRPAKLLCRLAKACASWPDSSESSTRMAYCSPILMLSLQSKFTFPAKEVTFPASFVNSFILLFH